MKLKKAFMAAATTTALGLGLAGNAQANVYAVAFGNIFDLQVTAQDSAGNFLPALAPQDQTEASATLNGANSSSGGVGNLDAPAVNAPGSNPASLRVDNVFTQIGPGGSTNYAGADAYLPFTQTGGDAYTQAIGITEAELGSTATASGSTIEASSAGFATTIVSLNNWTLSIAFDAIPYLRAKVDATEDLGSTASARINATATLNDINGNKIWEWSPQGDANNDVTGIIGGTELADGADLNRTIPANFPGDDGIYDPTGCGVDGFVSPGGTFNDAGNCGTAAAFAASSVLNGIAPGTYSLELNMNHSVGLQRVPEPATLALLGAGLIGLSLSTRRRKNKIA